MHLLAFLRYIDHCSYPPCRVRCPSPAERRPKFISVTVLGARFWECSTRSNWFNLCGNCYIYAVLRYVEPLTGFLERSIFVSGGLKPWLRSVKPCGLINPGPPRIWQGQSKRQSRRGFHALREGLWRLRNTSGMRPCRGAEALGYQGEARRRGLWRIISSKTIRPHVPRSSEEVQPL